MLVKRVDAEWKIKIHKALSFNNSYVSIPYSSSLYPLSQITVIAMFNPNSLSSDLHDVVSRHTNAYNAQGTIRTNGSRLESLITVGGILYSLKSNTILTKGKWYHTALTYNGSEITLFINGNKDVSISGKGKIANNQLSTTLGCFQTNSLEKFFGLIALVRIYNHCLSPSEIKYAYRHPYDPINKDHLVLDLNPAGIDVANSKWWDLSNKGNHGTIYNTTEVKLVEPEAEVS